MSGEEKEETKKMLEDHRYALEQAEIVFEGILKGLKLKNYFAENIKDHLEVSQQHMGRIEMSMIEDL